jgi:hypothetical protein
MGLGVAQSKNTLRLQKNSVSGYVGILYGFWIIIGSKNTFVKGTLYISPFSKMNFISVV